MASKTFFSNDKSLKATADKNLFGDGFSVALFVKSQAGGYHRTPIRYVLPKQAAATRWAQNLVAYGVTL